jgi:glycosyltransferase involved in cell wall biosynthesis
VRPAAKPPAAGPAPAVPAAGAAAPLRVLQLTETVCGDGGAIAVQRLDAGLRRLGIDSRVLVTKNPNPLPYVTTFRRGRTRLERLADRVCRRLLPALGLDELLDASSFRIVEDCAALAPDVLTVHGPTYGYLSPLALPALSQRFPSVLVLHDMLNFTGHCSHSFDCSRWRTGCGRCPKLDVEPRVRRDATAFAWRLKDWNYGRCRFAVVAPSTWIAELARASMLGRFPVHHVPHGVDTEIYRPLDREACRSALGIPAGRRVVLFVAANLSRPLKGADLLVTALQALPASLRRELTLLLVGNRGEAVAQAAGVDTIDLGFVASDQLKAMCFSAADVYVHPARAEVFGYVIAEAMACGTPTAAFAVGGIPDLVRPGISGALAPPEDAAALARAIAVILEGTPAERASLRASTVALAAREFALTLQAERYLALYRTLQAEQATRAG